MSNYGAEDVGFDVLFSTCSSASTSSTSNRLKILTRISCGKSVIRSAFEDDMLCIQEEEPETGHTKTQNFEG